MRTECTTLSSGGIRVTLDCSRISPGRENPFTFLEVVQMPAVSEWRGRVFVIRLVLVLLSRRAVDWWRVAVRRGPRDLLHVRNYGTLLFWMPNDDHTFSQRSALNRTKLSPKVFGRRITASRAGSKRSNIVMYNTRVMTRLTLRRRQIAVSTNPRPFSIASVRNPFRK